MSLELKVEDLGSDRVIHIAGELDLATAPALEEALEGADASGPQRIVVDLRDVEFMDSTGLRAILVAAKAAESRGASFALIQGPPAVHRVFEITQTADRLEWAQP